MRASLRVCLHACVCVCMCVCVVCARVCVGGWIGMAELRIKGQDGKANHGVVYIVSLVENLTRSCTVNVEEGGVSYYIINCASRKG